MLWIKARQCHGNSSDTTAKRSILLYRALKFSDGSKQSEAVTGPKIKGEKMLATTIEAPKEVAEGEWSGERALPPPA